MLPNLDNCVMDYFYCLDACLTDKPPSSPVTDEDKRTTEVRVDEITTMEVWLRGPAILVLVSSQILNANVLMLLYLYIIFDSNHQHYCALYDTYH